MKIDGHGQAAIISARDWQKLKAKCDNPSLKLILTIAWLTGERWGAILQLRVSDVYSDPTRREPRDFINFRAATRKGDRQGRRETRQVPIHPDLKAALAAYRPPSNGYLFPGREGDRPLSFRAAYDSFRRLLLRAGLDARGYSTHSFRRSFVTNLVRAGIDPKTVKALTGHKDWSSFARYIDSDPERERAALEVLHG